MSIEQIFNLLSSLTTPKRAFAGLIMVLTIIASLHFIEPHISLYLTNSSSLSVVLSALLGAFSGFLIHSGLLEIYNQITKRKEQRNQIQLYKQKKKIDAEAVEAERRNISRLFKKSYVHFNTSEIDVLRKLANPNGAVYTYDNSYIKYFGNNSWLYLISHQQGKLRIFCLKPFIAEYVNELWNHEVNLNTNAFMALENPLKSSILLALLDTSSDNSASITYNYDLFNQYNELLPDCFEQRFSLSEVVIKFKKKYKESFELACNHTLREMLTIKLERT
ncbi:TPA: hypothetical protein ACJ5GP_002022 [Yersinia enterocolitica]